MIRVLYEIRPICPQPVITIVRPTPAPFFYLTNILVFFRRLQPNLLVFQRYNCRGLLYYYSYRM